MAKENENGLYSFFGANLTAFNLAVKAKQIKSEYTLKTKINALMGFINNSNAGMVNP